MSQTTKSFAFKLAKQHKSVFNDKKWIIRDGVSVSGCTASSSGPFPFYRAAYNAGGYVGPDNGYHC